MEVSRNEMIETRKNLLKKMDTFLKENIREDVVIDLWLAYGLEDGWDDDILAQYANDDESWNDCVKIFRKCCEIERFL